jgi:hypothetical protein
MPFQFSNIRDFNVMYLSTMIGELMQIELPTFSFINKYYSDENLYKNIIFQNHYSYNSLISLHGGATNLKKNDLDLSLLLTINETIFDNFKDQKKLQLEINHIIKETNLYLIKEKINKKSIEYFTFNSAKLLSNPQSHDKNEYYSLIFLAVPFALKINDKKDLVQTLEKYIRKYNDDINQILPCITCALFINYALNDIGINIWIDKLNEDFAERNDCEKYLDYINNYLENNFRNGDFQIKAIEEFTIERNKSFLNNYCTKNNKLLSEKPQEQVLLIYDTLLRSKDNWEKLVLFGFCNWNDNPIISLVLGLLYEILYKNKKINKNLLKRFSFNL